MIEIGRVFIFGEGSLIEARRRILLLARSLGLGEIASTCVATGASEIARRLLPSQRRVELRVCVRSLSARPALALCFVTDSGAELDAAVRELFDRVERTREQGIPLLIASARLPPRDEPIEPGALRGQREILARRSRDELLHDMRALNEGLRARNQALKELTFSAAHTLRTDWLGAGYVLDEVLALLEPGPGEGVGAEAIELLEELRRRMAGGLRTVDGLLLYAQTVDDAAPVLQPLRPMLEGVLRRVGSDLIRLADDFQDASVLLDSRTFPVVLEELVCNGILYGEGRPVTVSLRDGLLRVRDEGRGIPGESLEQIFGIFQRATTDAGGVGLGLAVVKQIVMAHGFSIWAESEGPGKGSTFVIDLAPKEALHAGGARSSSR